MRILGKNRLTDYCSRPGRLQSREHLQAWHLEATAALWRNKKDILEKYPSAAVLDGGGVLFPFMSSDCQLLTKVDYKRSTVLVSYLGTAKELEKYLVEGLNGAN